MKVTSFEISKRLKKNGISDKIGFLDYYYNTDGELRHRNQQAYCEPENTVVDCFAYDLETILEALPDVIDHAIRYDPNEINDYQMMICKDSITILFLLNSYDYIYKEKGGSLADCAGKLLIWLHEKGLIKFEVENENKPN